MNPPHLAEALLAKFATEPLVGDLREQFAMGHTRAWYWRQVLIAVAMTTAKPSKHKA